MDRSPDSSLKQTPVEGRGLRRVVALAPAPQPQPAGSFIDASALFDTLYDSRFLIGTLTLVTTLIGSSYALLAAPVYQSDILIQVEDNSTSATDVLSSVSHMFDIKSVASDEIDILNSRLVLTTAVEQTLLYIDVRPKRFPVFGRWWSTHQTGLSTPGLFGYGGYVWAQEHASVSSFDMPPSLMGKPFDLIAGTGGQYTLDNDRANIHATGRVGQPLTVQSADGPLTLTVTELAAAPGGTFMLTRTPIVTAVESLKKDLRISQTTKDSDVIQASLQGTDRVKTSQVITAVGQQYVRQNVERKSAEAEKSIAFLNVQLPQLKHQLEASESAYNEFRARHATLDPGEESTAMLQQSVNAQNALAELEQKRNELTVRFTENHPAVLAILNQEAAMKDQLARLEAKTRLLPQLEQTEQRLQRDVQVNTDLYASLLNSAEQLRLARAGKTGNARLVDAAVVSEYPAKPNRALVIALAALVGLFGGCLIASLRKQMSAGVVHAREIERDTGLSVYASVSFSKQQRTRDAWRWSPGKVRKISLLAHHDGASLPIENLRSFRSALQFVMREASSNIVLIVGPTPGVGKSFIAANLVAVLAASDQRVLLVDADLRDGDLHRHFGLREAPGLADLVASDMPLDQIVHREVLPRLDVMSRGATPADPSELLMNVRLTRFLDRVRAQYDIVVIDTPPVLAVADVAALGLHAGAAFLVVRQNQTTIAQINESAKRLTQVGVALNGIVLNGVKPRPGDKAYGYGAYSYMVSRDRAPGN